MPEDMWDEMNKPWYDRYKNLIWIFLIVFAAGASWATVTTVSSRLNALESKTQSMELKFVKMDTDIDYIKKAVDRIDGKIK